MFSEFDVALVEFVLAHETSENFAKTALEWIGRRVIEAMGT
jgi:hypothetical protein